MISRPTGMWVDAAGRRIERPPGGGGGGSAVAPAVGARCGGVASSPNVSARAAADGSDARAG
ncbi:hypothetical protein EON68_01625 [archaeon]|nr:MAG: hypothetical protein EON68_01625 [archaeon]